MSDDQPEELQHWLWRVALPLWSSVGVDPSGGFYEGIDFAGQPIVQDQRLRVQARQTWAYANAHLRSPSSKWRSAMKHGLTHLLGPFRRSDGLFSAVVARGKVSRELPPLLYDQAFALLALAAVHRAEPEFPQIGGSANSLMRGIHAAYGLPSGGYREAAPETPFYANPIMHLFEAVMAWEEVEPFGDWGEEADAIAGLALSRLIDPASGVLREHFDEAWAPAAGSLGDLAEPGHQFEWSWLLRRWGVSRGRADAIAAADRLFDIGARWGVDRSRGVVINSIRDDFTPLDRAARLWPQTEWLKAATTAARAAENPPERLKFERQKKIAASAVSIYLDTELPGLWRDWLSAESSFEDVFAPASSLYHLSGVIFEL